MVHPEAMSRISEPGFADYEYNINPHHVTTALRGLHDEEVIVTHKEVTRGGHLVATITFNDLDNRASITKAAAARKRLLMARYTGWSQGTKRHPHGLIGPAGEHAVRSAILSAETVLPTAPGAGEVGYILGTRLTGKLDSAGLMVPMVKGLPEEPVTLLFEVKNLRSWIYPSSSELYQLLHKGIVLQKAQPTQPIVPILACRRAHKTSFWMAKQLGFVIIDMGVQFGGDVDETALDDIRNELHFTDLRAGSGPSLRVRDRLRDTLPGICTKIADEWQTTAMTEPLSDAIEDVRAARSTKSRLRRVDELRAVAVGLGYRGGW